MERIMVSRKNIVVLANTQKSMVTEKEEITTEGKHRGVMEKYLGLDISVRTR